jgi:hypothetical protein
VTLLICWVAAPLVLGVISLGCGLLVETVAGSRLPGALVPPIGLALVVVISSLATASSATASLATPAVVALALAGLLLSPAWRRWPLWQPGRRVALWGVAAAIAVYAVFAAPIVLSGGATFTGYIKLDDTATFLALIDRAMSHGRDLSGLAPSTYEATLAFNLPSGYPLGSMVPLGVTGQLIGQDNAWLYQPYLALVAAMLALTLYELVRPAIPSRAARAGVAFLASQSALLYGYVMWGGIKEVAGALLIALVAAVIPHVVRPSDRRGGLSELRATVAGVRRLLPLCVASGAMFDALSLGTGVWLGPILLIALGLLAVPLIGLISARALAARSALAELAGQALGFAALTAALAMPAIVTTSSFLGGVGVGGGGGGPLTSSGELGNLIRPLKKLQLFGIWPTGDFRLDPAHMTAADILIAVTALGGLAGLAMAVYRQRWGLVAYIAAAGIGALVFEGQASPWVAGKAFASGSPAFLLLGLAGVAAIWDSGSRVASPVVGVVAIVGSMLMAAAIASGVLWSNFLAYQDVNLAPRSRMAELANIGERFAGQGPALMTEYEPIAVRHFLRRIDAEGASELRRRAVPLIDGTLVSKGGSADLDRFALPGILVYRTLVIRRSPAESRPPSVYTLSWRGAFYDVWQRPPGSVGRIFSHLGLGSEPQAGAIPACTDITHLARRPGVVRLAAAPAPLVPVVDLRQAPHPASWSAGEGDGSVIPLGAGTVAASVTITTPGRYWVFLRGSFKPALSVSIDGRPVASLRHELTHSNDDYPLGLVDLAPGRHDVTLRLGGTDLHPGSGRPNFPGFNYSMGPILLGTMPDDRPIVYVPPRAARSLCGRRLDWVEALSS